MNRTVIFAEALEGATPLELQNMERMLHQKLLALRDKELNEGEKLLIDNHKMIDTIKSYRNRTGSTLKEAKARADDYRALTPTTDEAE